MMELYSERTKLRALTLGDAHFLAELINDPFISEKVIGSSFPISEEHEIHWLMNKIEHPDLSEFRAVIELTETMEAIGTVTLSNIDYINANAIIHIKIKETSTHQGIGFEVINCLIQYAFNYLRLECLYAEILEDNLPSIGLFRKLAFKQDGIFRNRIYKSGHFKSVLLFSLLKEEYKVDK